MSISIAIGERVPRALDLCTRCHRELLQPVLDALSAHGVSMQRFTRPERQRNWKRNVGPFLCRAGCGFPPHRSAATLEAHLNLIHDGMTFDEYVEQHGELVAMTTDEIAQLVVEARCSLDDCGKLYSTELGHRWPHQALRSHLLSRHGIKWKPGEPLP